MEEARFSQGRQEVKLCGKVNKKLGKFIDMNPGFYTAEEKVMEGSRYWKPTGDERFSAIRIRWDKIMGMLVENRRNLSPKNKRTRVTRFNIIILAEVILGTN